MKTCIVCQGAIPSTRHTNAKTCSEECSLAHRRAKGRKYSQEHYQRNASEIIDRRREYGKAWRRANPDRVKHHNEIRLAEYTKIAPEIDREFLEVISRCTLEQARELCQDWLDSNDPDIRRFVRSYKGDDILSSYLDA